MRCPWLSISSSILLCLSSFGCESDITTGTNFYINVAIQNSTPVTLSVYATNTYGNNHVRVNAPPGFITFEINGTSGDRVEFDVSGPGGYAGTGGCTATNAIVGTDEYGQVNLFVAEGTTVTVACSSGWLEFLN
jgi:hypothetical protein